MGATEETTIRELTEEIERLTAELAALQGKHEEVIRGRNLATERAEKAEETLRKVRVYCETEAAHYEEAATTIDPEGYRAMAAKLRHVVALLGDGA